MKSILIVTVLASILTFISLSEGSEKKSVTCTRAGESFGLETFWFELDVDRAETNEAACNYRYIVMSGPIKIVDWQDCATKRSKDSRLGAIRSYESKNINLKIFLDLCSKETGYCPAKVWLPGVTGNYAIAEKDATDIECRAGSGSEDAPKGRRAD